MSFPLGGFIAKGSYREVYAHRDNPEWVVKVQRQPYYVSNSREFIIWNTCFELRPWLVPVIAISCDKQHLIMVRGVSLKELKTTCPTRHQMPACFEDTGTSNWVMIQGKRRFCDYAQEKMMINIFGDDIQVDNRRQHFNDGTKKPKKGVDKRRNKL